MIVEDLDLDELNGTLDNAIEYLQNVKRNLNHIGVTNIKVHVNTHDYGDRDPILEFYIAYDTPNKIFDFNDIDTRESKF